MQKKMLITKSILWHTKREYSDESKTFSLTISQIIYMFIYSCMKLVLSPSVGLLCQYNNKVYEFLIEF